jgi:outer membrane beta-barrel protein
MRKLAYVLGLLSVVARAEGTLEEELSKLKVEPNKAPAIVEKEKLYAVQSRANPLKFTNLLGVGFSYNTTANSFLTSEQFDLNYRFYISDRWFAGIGGSYVLNQLSQAGDRLYQTQGAVPDLSYVKYRAHALFGANTFYGKIRLTQDYVMYLDHFIELGPGVVKTNFNNAISGVVGTGLSLWFNKWFSFELGVKNIVFKEQRALNSSVVDHLLLYSSVGVLLGGT